MVPNSPRIRLHPKLHEVAKNGDRDTLERLVPTPTQVEVQIAIPVEGEAHEPLHARCLLGVTHGGNTALHIAARFGHRELAEAICVKNVSLLTKDNDMLETPLHYAAKAGWNDIVADFIQLANSEANNIDLREILTKRNRDGETALYQAVLYDHPAVVNNFLHEDANPYVSQLVSIPNNENISPLYLAILRGFHDIFTSLIESLHGHGVVSREAYSGPNGQTALHAAVLSPQCIFEVERVLDWKPELANSTDNLGSTPLHYAASSGNLGAIRAILQKNIDCAYVADSSGLYPVHVAVKMGFVKVVAELFDLCPDLDELLDKNGRNFVHLAVEDQEENIVQWICRKTEFAKAMNAQDNNGDTAMHLAVKTEHINIFARLLETKNVHLGMMNKEGLTPFDLAVSKRPVEMSFSENPNDVMLRTLSLLKSHWGINRRDHFVSEHRQQFDQKKEKIVESYESVAKNMAIGTVLIASAAFASAFSVSLAYKSDFLAGKTYPGLDFAFMSFLLMIVYAFVCSIVATSLLIHGALTYIDPIYRKNYIFISARLIRLATQGFVASFAIGVYVVLTPLSKWLACLVCVIGAVVTILMHSYVYPNFLVIKALYKYLGMRGSSRTIFWDIWLNILFGIFVLLVLAGSLVSSHSALVPTVLVLGYGTAIIIVSVLRSFPAGVALVKKLNVIPRRMWFVPNIIQFLFILAILAVVLLAILY